MGLTASGPIGKVNEEGNFASIEILHGTILMEKTEILDFRDDFIDKLIDKIPEFFPIMEGFEDFMESFLEIRLTIEDAVEELI